MTPTEFLEVSVMDQVATVTFSRPPVNALNREAYRQIRDVFRSFEDRTDTSVVVFTATGDRAFMAGADLKEQAELAAAGLESLPVSARLDRGKLIRDSFWAVKDCVVPVVIALNGPAIGAGLAFAAVADLIIAAEGVTLSATEIDVGMLGSAAQLIRLVGHFRARELFYTGGKVTVEELRAHGSVSRVVPRADLLRTAHEVAAVVASKSPLAVRLAKEAFLRTDGLPLEDAYRLEQDYTFRLRQFADSAEAQRAVAEKRPPHWGWS